MIEIEIKAKITNPKIAFEKIQEIGGVYSHTEIQRDIYFNGENKDFKKTDEALRIREIPDGDDFINILTFKGPKLDSKTKTRKEIEVTINDKDNMTEILINLGYKPSAIVNKVRRIFKYDKYTITVDKLNELGYFIEIEYVTKNSEDIEVIQDKIFEIFNQMDITEGFEKKSYLELLEKNKVNNIN
ncbi:MAG: class IV adenylate cyclase [Methanosphaera stadtmanae]|nr:class IV adenylate cyclase [Methanosphaera stadtmanae]